MERNFAGFPGQTHPTVPGSPPRAPIPSPQPHYPVGNATGPPSRPSTQPPGNRNRSPSASTSLSDLAHQGKKAFLGFLQDGPSRGGTAAAIKESFGERPNAALRNVRAKREAEDADKEYRRGVHWLETLRLRRQTVLRSAYAVSPTYSFHSKTILILSFL